MGSFFIKRPGNGRRSYAIAEKHGKTVRDSRIDAINTSVREGKLDHSQAEDQLQSICEELRRKNRPDRAKWSSANELLANRCFRDVYTERELVGKVTVESKEAARWTFDRVLTMLGPLQLSSASLTDLQSALLKSRPASRKHLAVGLNQLLKYIGRTERVFAPKGRTTRCRYLTVEEMEIVLPHIPETLRLPVVVAFAAGCRLGEVFAVKRRVGTGSIWVETQVTRKLVTKVTKNRREREATVIPDYLPSVVEWLKVPTPDRDKIRRVKWHNVVRRACEAAFPGDRDKACTFHDLRHSYAVHWFDLLGARALKVVANCLGDSAEVTEMYYGWRVQTAKDEDMMLEAAALRKAKA